MLLFGSSLWRFCSCSWEIREIPVRWDWPHSSCVRTFRTDAPGRIFAQKWVGGEPGREVACAGTIQFLPRSAQLPSRLTNNQVSPHLWIFACRKLARQNPGLVKKGFLQLFSPWHELVAIIWIDFLKFGERCFPQRSLYFILQIFKQAVPFRHRYM